MAWNYTYEELLKRARTQLPKEVFEKKRFEVPRVKGMIQGNKTVITNIHQISDILGRPINHLMKFLLRELATAGGVDASRVIFTGKFSSVQLNDKINKYVKEYVLCKECGKPDTKLVKDNRITFLKCLACGARRSVKTLR